MSAVRAPAEVLWRSLRLPADAISRLRLTEQPDPIVNSSFLLGTAAQASHNFAVIASYWTLHMAIDGDRLVWPCGG